MSLSISATAETELGEHTPNFLRVAKIIKNFYNADTRDTTVITDRVMSYGRLVRTTTLATPDFEKANLTMIVKNDDNFFTKNSSSSIWEAAPAAHHKQCVLLFELYVLPRPLMSLELVLRYYGKIDNVVVHLDETMSIAELVTIMEQDAAMRKVLTKSSGGSYMRPYKLF